MSVETESKTDVVHSGFMALLEKHNNGLTVRELDRRLQETVCAIRETGKAGTIIPKITLKPAKGDVNRIVIDIDDDGKIPKPPRPSTLLFSTDEGTLQQDHPDQMTFGQIVD